VLVSGCAMEGRRLRPFEAVVAVAATCNLGLEHLVERARANDSIGDRASDLLGREGAEKLFRVGWWLLYNEVALATCGALSRAFAVRASATPDVALRHALERSARLFEEKRAQGKPALARNRLSDLPMGAATHAVIEGLLCECPLLMGALVERGANRYELDRERQFIASKADLDRVRAFLRTLEALGGSDGPETGG
jgi:hypothetical protein